MTADDDLASQLAAEALRLADQREFRATGPVWYDNMLGILKDTITGSSNTRKAQLLAQLAAGNRHALYEARRKLIADHCQSSNTEKASSLLMDAVLITISR